jgi:hypothetical protein
MKSFNSIISLSYKGILLMSFLLLTCFSSCKKFLEIPLPTNKVSGSSAYTNDKSSAATINHILGNLASSSLLRGTSVGFFTGLYSDELTSYSVSQTNINYYRDAIPLDGANSYWVNFYNYIYDCNLAIEGIQNSTSTITNKNQWIGEALFTRALLYFNLVNLYGDVPLATTSDYRLNNTLVRTPKAEVYKQMIIDLKEAQGLLNAKYLNGSSAVTNDRTRPNKQAATALLARIYLYTGDWVNAEQQASLLIDNKTDFSLPALNQVFLSSSKETIFSLGLEPTDTTPFVSDILTYSYNVPAIIPAGKTLNNFAAATMSASLFSSFENGDQRLVSWGALSQSNVVAPAQPVIYHLVSKYKSVVNGAENIVVLRLAEQYLIRAEARAQQNKLTGADGAKPDLDAVRIRAGLAGSTETTKDGLLAAIIKERRTELFSEMGHRFFDLKRTGTIDVVMAVEAPLKGGQWNSQRQIWPIPTADINSNNGLTQAPGY